MSPDELHAMVVHAIVCASWEGFISDEECVLVLAWIEALRTGTPPPPHRP